MQHYWETTPEDLKTLDRGDIVRHSNGDSYVVIVAAYGNQPAVAVRDIQVSNPTEWKVIKRHNWKEDDNGESTTKEASTGQ